MFARGRIGVGLHHREHAAVGQRILGHREVARFENVQRQLAARKQQRTGKRKDREFGGQMVSGCVERRHLAEQDGGQAPPSGLGDGIVGAPGFEEF